MIGNVKRIAVVLLLSTTLAGGAAEAMAKVDAIKSKLITSSSKLPMLSKLRNILESSETLENATFITIFGVSLSTFFAVAGMETPMLLSLSGTAFSSTFLLSTMAANNQKNERLENELRAAHRSTTQEQQDLLLENIGEYVEVSSMDDLLILLEELPSDADVSATLNDRINAAVEGKGGFPLVAGRAGLILNNGDFVSFTDLYGEDLPTQ